MRSRGWIVVMCVGTATLAGCGGAGTTASSGIIGSPRPSIVQSPSASAEGEQLSGRIEIRGEGQRTAVERLSITAVSEGFEGSATTGSDGEWVIPVPAQGVYEVTIDVETLPDGVALLDPAKKTFVITVDRPNMDRVVLFPVGARITQP